MSAVVYEETYNERFIAKTVKEISEKFKFNIIQQQVITDILYKCTKNVEIIIVKTL